MKIGDVVETEFGNAVVSRTGYRWDSPDLYNPLNLIPSNRISMVGVNFPVLGVDNLGNVTVMKPEHNYIFQGDYVLEFPLMKL